MADGDHEDIEGEGQYFKEGELAELIELYKEEAGAHLDEIEDEEEYKEKWWEWVLPRITIKYGRQKRLPPTKLE